MRLGLYFSLFICLFLVSLAHAQNSQPVLEEALRRIREAEATGAIELDLSRIGLAEIPPEVFNLSQLEILDLHENFYIRSVPAEIGRLTNLRVLDLRTNMLKNLPPEIANLSNLCFLDLSDNALRHLPSELAQLRQLVEARHNCRGQGKGLYFDENPLIFPPEAILQQETPLILDYLGSEAISPYELALQLIQITEATGASELDLCCLRLTELPPEIGNLSQLETLLLYDNALSTLPPEIGNLSNLRNLQVWRNQLSSIPPEIGNLGNLENLGLSHNLLSVLPSEIGNLSNLRDLAIHNNQLESLPPEIGNLSSLACLYLHNNQLQALPLELGQGTQLESNLPCRATGDAISGLDSNPLRFPPEAVIEQGTSAVLEYLRNEAWWHLQRLILSALATTALLVAAVLGLRWRRGKSKRKHSGD